ncbi:uncharacterized protein [Euphorbia lathyris]|uniref:uncharacterized protein n=1 Tax=Euphorbia lathyris TaxID=212925 RepID=UPI00331436C1
MTRKKVKLTWIANDRARKTCLKNRSVGACKKVEELTTLCGVKAFMIIYSPDEAEPMMIWPSRPEVKEIIAKFLSIPELERCKKMMNQESFLKERMGKIGELTDKDAKKNREGELSFLMNKLNLREFDYNCLQPDETLYLTWLIEERMEDIKKRFCYVQRTIPLVPVVQPGTEVARRPPPPPPSFEVVQQGAGVFRPPPSPLPPSVEMVQQGGSGVIRANLIDSMMWDQWFLDMLKNSDNVAGGSGSGSGAPPRTPPPPPPHFGGGGGDVGALGPRLSGGNLYFDLPIMTPPNPNPFGIGLTPRDIGGSSSNVNPLGFEPIQLPTTLSPSATKEGLSGFFPSRSEVAMLPCVSNFGIGVTPRDFGGSSSNVNPLGFKPIQLCGVVSSSAAEEGLSGFFPSGSEVAKFPWPPNFGIGVTPADFGGSSSNVNPLGFEPIQLPGTISSSPSEENLSGFFPSGSEVARLPWPPNFGIGVTPTDFGGSSSNANPLGFEPIQLPGTISSSAAEEGLSGFFSSGSELAGLP